MKLRTLSTLATICLLSAAASTATANLLVNGDFEATPADVYFDGFDPTLADDVPGWNLFLGAADGSYVYVNGFGSANVDVDTANGPSGGGLETAVGSRPAVVPGYGYTASVTYDNYFSAGGAAYYIDWFDGVGALLGSIGGALGDPNGPLVYEPYTQSFSVLGIAPASATAAGVRFTAANAGYNGVAADNFSLVPEPTSLALFGLAFWVLIGLTIRKRS
jgi:hypothetical protein